MASLGTLHAQTLTFAPTTHPAATGARGAVSFDVNRDGWMDVASANTGRNTVAILINRGAAGGFLAPLEIPVGAGPFDIAAGDLDRDGVPDLAVAAPDAPRIEVLLMRSNGSVKSRAVVSSVESRGLTIADVTRDGALDVVVSDYARNRIVVLPGNSRGGFLAARTYSIGVRPQGVTVADFNRDGFPDIAVANTTGSVLTVLHGTSSAAVTSRTFAAGRTHNVLTALDINSDGWFDIAAASTATNVVSFFRGSSSGFALAGTRATGASPRGIASGDFNHDGRPDIAVGNFTSHSVTVLLGRRDGSALADRWGDLPAGSGARALAAADFNHDGRMDIAATAQSSSSMTLFANDTAFVRAGFAFSRQPFSHPLFGTPTIADFNENGRPDVMSHDQLLLDDGTLVRPLNLRLLDRLMDTRAADINRDGHTDLVFALERFNEFEGVEIYVGDGRGGFTFTWSLGGMASIRSLELGDVNRDGQLDIVADGSRQLYVARQTEGQFQIDVYPLGTFRASGLRLIDIDRDGDLDIVTFQAPDSINVRRGDGAGGFADAINVTLPVSGIGFQWGDFNEDGRLDLVVTEDTIAVLLATGDLTWGPPVEYEPTGPPTQSLTSAIVGDFNHDGHLDVFSASGGLLAGRGDGTLAFPEDFDVEVAGEVPFDWNEDGLVDIVAGGLVMLNERRATNRPPVADAGPDMTIGYEHQFGEEANMLVSRSTDPDLHRLRHEWREADGTLLFGDERFAFFPARPPGTYTFTVTVRDGRGGQATDTVTVTITPFAEIVMHAAQWVNSTGWQFVEDTTAASEIRAFYPNADAPKVTTAVPAPSSFVDFFITPDPTQTYKLWVRLKAQDNRGHNDSIWVQFSGAVDPSGRPNYRIGTTEGLEVNLEECLGCRVSEWGWEDDGWGAVNRNGVLLRFPSGGPQTLRVQIREDGVSFDQIVLSAVKYRTARPGTAKNDTIILPMTQPGAP